MHTLLAHAADGSWPGPWILLVPLFWLSAVLLVVLVVRRVLWRRGGCGYGWGYGRGADSPLAALGRRYADGEIDADEYRARRAVLTERHDLRGGAK
ncbi:SHOCT domain-containing protein [Kitasatospora terrestris]|uniref:SHOCT domain-containing protein n=1 Tax=Kitasatospora terrestris TaxID=258051 RepID=A0ABP9DD91_9ACTN